MGDVLFSGSAAAADVGDLCLLTSDSAGDDVSDDVAPADALGDHEGGGGRLLSAILLSHILAMAMAELAFPLVAAFGAVFVVGEMFSLLSCLLRPGVMR